jgi:hypothetical protein
MIVTVKETSPGVGCRVVHGGVAHSPGETVDVPEEVARDWAASGWIEPPKFKSQPPEAIAASDVPSGFRSKPASSPKRKPRAQEPVTCSSKARTTDE